MIIDISQELTHCNVFEGDIPPKREQVMNMNDGSTYNLSNITMCLHNGTHVDAPYHFINDKNTIDKIPLDYFVGSCFVAEAKGDITIATAIDIMNKAKAQKADKRILLKGDCTVTLEAAKIFADNSILLLGNESQTVGPINSPKAVHLELLKKDIVLLEGINLKGADEGKYFLSCAPLNIAGADGSPCRAYLIKE